MEESAARPYWQKIQIIPARVIASINWGKQNTQKMLSKWAGPLMVASAMH